MEKEEIGKLLGELADATAEPIRDELAEDIKRDIPEKLNTHKAALDTVRIMIDLRVSKLAAAAVIILTMVLCASFLNGRDRSGTSVYQEGKLLINYFLTGEDTTKNDVLALYDYLIGQGREVVYYGDSVDVEDSGTVLMQWKLVDSEDEYKIIVAVFGDLRIKTVSAEELIKLQGRMLQKKNK